VLHLQLRGKRGFSVFDKRGGTAASSFCGEEGALLLAGENKRKFLMKEGGACPGLAFVNRDREACGRP